MSDRAGSSRKTTLLLGSATVGDSTVPISQPHDEPTEVPLDERAPTEGTLEHTEVQQPQPLAASASKSRLTVGVSHPESAFSTQQGHRGFQTLAPTGRATSPEPPSTPASAAADAETKRPAEGPALRGRHTLDPSHPQTAFGSQQGQRAFHTLGPDRGSSRTGGARGAGVDPAATSQSAGRAARSDTQLMGLFDLPPPLATPTRFAPTERRQTTREAPTERGPRSQILRGAAAFALLALVAGGSYWLGARSASRPLDTEARANLRAVDSQPSITLAPSTPALAVPSEIPAPEASPSSASDVGSPASDDASVTAQDPAAHSDDAVERGPEARASRRRTQGTRRPRTPHGPITQTPF